MKEWNVSVPITGNFTSGGTAIDPRQSIAPEGYSLIQQIINHRDRITNMASQAEDVGQTLFGAGKQSRSGVVGLAGSQPEPPKSAEALLQELAVALDNLQRSLDGIYNRL
jgi:hypothetical protein